MSTVNDFNGYNPTWCPGCGNWTIGASVKAALAKLNLDPSSLFAVFGIGCSGNMNDFLNCYAIHSLHGRSIPSAIGLKIANHKMKVIAIVGDGDCYGEGGNHFLHACRGNHDIAVIVHDNRVYGLTTGQVAPTAQKGAKSKSTPKGIIEVPVDPLSLAISQGATFVSQTFTADVAHVTDNIKKGLEHKGFALVNVLQPCVTFNKINTLQYYKERVYNVESMDKKSALLELQKANDEEKFPLGVIFKEERPVYTDSLPQITETALIDSSLHTDFRKILSDF